MIILVDPDRYFRSRASSQLAEKDQVIEFETLTQAENYLASRPGETAVLILGPSLPFAEALPTSESMQISAPQISVIVVTNSLTSELLQGALRAGIKDVLPSSYTPMQLLETVDRASNLSQQMKERSQTPPVQEPSEPGKVIAVFSAKGGCGKSFIASNLAVLLARKTMKPIVLVDLDLEFGDLAIMLQLFPARTIHDASQNLGRLDAEALKGYLTPHSSGISLLAAPLEPGLAETISAASVRTILQMLRENFEYVIVDTPAVFNDHVLAALDESDNLALLTSMDVPSIKNLKLSLQTLNLLGYSRDKLFLVLNRADSRVGLRLEEVEKVIGSTIDVSVSSSRDVPLSINQGNPLAVQNPKSAVVGAISRLIDAFQAQHSAKPAGHAGRFRLGRRA